MEKRGAKYHRERLGEALREEIETILDGVWDNLGRVIAEFAHLDHVWDFDPERQGKGRVEIPPRSVELLPSTYRSKSGG